MENPLWLKPEVVTRCEHCGERQPLAVAAVGYQCRSCAADWRWAACASCGRLDIVREELPLVECSGCHAVQVAWWKTSESESIAELVAARRRAVEARRRRNRTRWAILIGLLVGLALFGSWISMLSLQGQG